MLFACTNADRGSNRGLAGLLAGVQAGVPAGVHVGMPEVLLVGFVLGLLPTSTRLRTDLSTETSL